MTLWKEGGKSMVCAVPVKIERRGLGTFPSPAWNRNRDPLFEISPTAIDPIQKHQSWNVPTQSPLSTQAEFVCIEPPPRNRSHIHAEPYLRQQPLMAERPRRPVADARRIVHAPLATYKHLIHGRPINYHCIFWSKLLRYFSKYTD